LANSVHCRGFFSSPPCPSNVRRSARVAAATGAGCHAPRGPPAPGSARKVRGKCGKQFCSGVLHNDADGPTAAAAAGGNVPPDGPPPAASCLPQPKSGTAHGTDSPAAATTPIPSPSPSPSYPSLPRPQELRASPSSSHRTLPSSLTPLKNAGDTSFDRCPCIPAAMRWCAHIIATLFLSLTSQKNAALVLSLLPKYSNRDLNPPSHPFSPKVPDKPFHGPLYGNRCVWPGVPPTPSRVASYSAHLILPPVRRCPQIRDVPPASLAIVLGSCIMLVPARRPPLYLVRCPILPAVRCPVENPKRSNMYR